MQRLITSLCIAGYTLIFSSAAAVPQSGGGHDHDSHAGQQGTPAPNTNSADEAIIRAQLPSYPLKACVVSGDELGGDEPPIDYVVNGKLVRLCCKGCKKDVDTDPAAAFKKIDAAVIAAQKPTYPLTTDPVTGEKLGDKTVDYVYGTRLVRFANADSIKSFEKDPHAAMAKIDKALIEAQRPSYPLKTCVVSGEALGGEMGEPIDYLYGTRLIRFCCKECPAKLEKDPTPYLKKLDEAAKEKAK